MITYGIGLKADTPEAKQTNGKELIYTRYAAG